jgi:hypothetical protein
MKTRTGFVSNSSSSSFVCDVCGREESGMDMCLSDAQMTRCKKYDHTFCESEAVKSADELTVAEKRQYLTDSVSGRTWLKPDVLAVELAKISAMTDEEVNKEVTEDSIDSYELPSAMCPVCCMTVLTDNDALNYLYKLNNLDSKKLLEALKSAFPSGYDDFQKYLKG